MAKVEQNAEFDYEGDRQLEETVMELPKNSSFNGQEVFSQEVAYFLVGLNLEKYIDLFHKENVSLELLLSLTRQDLHNIGITDEEECSSILESVHLKRNASGRSDINDNFLLNPNDDVLILKNVISCTTMLNKNIRQILSLMSRSHLSDYYVTREQSAVDLLKMATEKSIQHTEIIKTKIHCPWKDSIPGLLQKIVLKEGIHLPKNLLRRLDSKRKMKRGALFLLGIGGIGCFIALVAQNYS